MQDASVAQDYELAADYRDRIRALTSIQAHQDINLEGVVGDADVIALSQKQGQTCVQVFFFRAGRNYGNRSYFPRHDKEETVEAIFAAFMAQFYENKPVPREILVSHMPQERGLLQEALSQKAGAKVKIARPEKGPRRKLLSFVEKNARGALEQHLTQRAGESKLLEGVAELFGLDSAPARIRHG